MGKPPEKSKENFTRNPPKNDHKKLIKTTNKKFPYSLTKYSFSRDFPQRLIKN
jgi:hypothetical protein